MEAGVALIEVLGWTLNGVAVTPEEAGAQAEAGDRLDLTYALAGKVVIVPHVVVPCLCAKCGGLRMRRMEAR